MQFSQQTIYNEKLQMQASEIFIASLPAAMESSQIDLLENFLQIIHDEMHMKVKNFRLIIPDLFYPYISQMNKNIRNHLSIKVQVSSRDAASLALMTQIHEDGYDLSVEVKDQFVIDILPKNTRFVFIDAEVINMLTPEQLALIVSYQCIACEVNDYAQIDRLKEKAIYLYCGQFIETPKLINVQTISPSKTAILSLMSSLSDPDIELKKVTQLVTTDSILTFKILKIINSPIYRGVSEIKSVQDAIVRFGFMNLKKWIMMLSLFSLGDKPTALIKMALQRAIMCAKLSTHLKIADPNPHYTTGLLSLIDAFLDLPLSKLLAEISISSEIKIGILEGKGELGQVLSIVKKYQRGDLTFKDPILTQIFLDSLEETNTTLKAIGL